MLSEAAILILCITSPIDITVNRSLCCGHPNKYVSISLATCLSYFRPWVLNHYCYSNWDPYLLPRVVNEFKVRARGKSPLAAAFRPCRSLTRDLPEGRTRSKLSSHSRGSMMELGPAPVILLPKVVWEVTEVLIKSIPNQNLISATIIYI